MSQEGTFKPKLSNDPPLSDVQQTPPHQYMGPKASDSLSAPTQSNAEETKSSLNSSTPEFVPHPTETTLYLDARRTVLLQTAVAEGFNPMDRNRKESVLDSGSQHSYLTEHLRLRLGLESVSTQNLAIARGAKPCDIVRIGI